MFHNSIYLLSFILACHQMLKVLTCHIFYKITLNTRTQLIWEMLLELTEEITKLILQEFRQAKQVYGTSAIVILGLAVE